VVFGEIGLSGEIRPVSQVELRLKEAEKLGFTRAWIAPRRKAPGKTPGKAGATAAAGPKAPAGGQGLAVEEIPHLQDLVARLTVPGPQTPGLETPGRAGPSLERHGRERGGPARPGRGQQAY
jgi:DNA repair protein RadA/Sms